MNLLKKIYTKIESLRGKQLIYLFVGIFIVCLPLGVLSGYFISPVLNKNEISDFTTQVTAPSSKVTRQGRIVYSNPINYPNEKISYILKQVDGTSLLLTAKDDKLKVSEGLGVTLKGTLRKTQDGQPLLFVEEVILNAAD